MRKTAKVIAAGTLVVAIAGMGQSALAVEVPSEPPADVLADLIDAHNAEDAARGIQKPAAPVPGEQELKKEAEKQYNAEKKVEDDYAKKVEAEYGKAAGEQELKKEAEKQYNAEKKAEDKWQAAWDGLSKKKPEVEKDEPATKKKVKPAAHKKVVPVKKAKDSVIAKKAKLANTGSMAGVGAGVSIALLLAGTGAYAIGRKRA